MKPDAAVTDIFLHPGELHFAAGPGRIGTLLGSCVAVCLNAIVRGKAVPMEVCATPFVPTRYYRG